MRGKVLFVLLASAMLTVGACTAQGFQGQGEGNASISGGVEETNIMDTLIARGDFGTLVTAIQQAGLEDTLRGSGPFTLFAPTDGAFAVIPQGNLNELLSNTTELTDVLMNHMVRGELMSSDLMSRNSLETMGGQTLTVTANGNAIMVNNANVIEADVEATNGVIHVVDAVLMSTQVVET